MLVPDASGIWTKSYVQTTQNFELFDQKKKKNGFFITIFDKELTPIWKTFL